MPAPFKCPAALFALTVWGCASSPLVRKEDPSFVRSLERYRSSLENRTCPGGVSETALFMQGEAFFWYRPGMESPGAFAMAAQALAASTDFAPLSVWAASSEINQLRMQSYNGAVQIYEML